jgi:site-specific DNA recombinase
MMVQMLGVFAEFEGATIIDRVIARMERKAAKCGWCGGALPFGYNVDRDAGHLTVNPLEAPLVATIFELYGHGRLGARAIATQLNTQGRRTKAGRPWSHTAVLTVLANRVYLGEVYFRGTHHPAPHRRWPTRTCSGLFRMC